MQVLWLSGKQATCQCRRHKRHGFCPWVRKIPWRRKWQPALCSCLGNPMESGAWWATGHGVAELDTPVGLSRHREHFYYSGELTYTTQYSGGSRHRKEPSLQCCYSVLFGSQWKAETGPGGEEGTLSP